MNKKIEKSTKLFNKYTDKINKGKLKITVEELLILINLKDDLAVSTQKKVLEQMKIADKYAVDFVKWLDRNKKETKHLFFIEELLEMYKNDIRRDNS
jgi:hypothetical protein